MGSKISGDDSQKTATNLLYKNTTIEEVASRFSGFQGSFLT